MRIIHLSEQKKKKKNDAKGRRGLTSFMKGFRRFLFEKDETKKEPA